jgi:hypothetical protein
MSSALRQAKEEGRENRLMTRSAAIEKQDQDAYAKMGIHECDEFWKVFNECAKSTIQPVCLIFCFLY